MHYQRLTMFNDVRTTRARICKYEFCYNEFTRVGRAKQWYCSEDCKKKAYAQSRILLDEQELQKELARLNSRLMHTMDEQQLNNLRVMRAELKHKLLYTQRRRKTLSNKEE